MTSYALAAVLAQALGAGPAVAPPGNLGPFSEESVQRVIESHRTEVEGCLAQSIEERTSEKKAVREGAVVVRFTISPKGSVRAASIKRSEPKSNEFHACLLAHIKAWVFPKPDDHKSHPIEYPFDVKLQK